MPIPTVWPSLKKKLRGQVIVSDILYQKDLIQSVNDNMSRIGLVLLALAIVLMLISFALISNTIRLGAYSKRFLIHTMKLVGGYTGIHSSALYRFQCDQRYRCIGNSYVVAFGLHILSDVRDGELHDPAVCSHDGIGLLSVLILGIILTAVSAYWAVNRYIRMDRDDLYYI